MVDELERRRKNPFRKRKEAVWKEVDRQIAMEKPEARQRNPEADENWHSAIQLGELADASEILAADTLRLAFPTDRRWFASHAELPTRIDPETGEQLPVDPRRQRTADEVLRNLMVQQHQDFGLRDRVKLAVKEALHHGSFVAIPEWETMAKFHDGGSRVESLGATVWNTYSMWDCYPDSSPSIVGTDLFYRGSMIIRRKMKQEKFRETGWQNIKKVLDSLADGEDVQLVIYYGDLYIPRRQGKAIWLPNRRVIVEEKGKHFLFSEVNQTPYSPVIYTGYEKDDVRDPYYTSPLIKRSPIHKMATENANKFLDGVARWVEPPVLYDGNDPRFQRDGGPSLAPGSKSAVQSPGATKELKIGDPTIAFQAMQWGINSVQKGTGVDSVRAGVSAGTEQTATEVVKSDQKSEIRIVDFVGTLERQGLTAFLVMQHDLNLLKLKNYPFYNNEIHTPDFLRASKSELPKAVRFEITGSRQLLGEEQRTARFQNAVIGAAQVPQISQRINWETITQQVFEDTGVKDPERFIIDAEDGATPEVAALQQQMQEFAEQAQAQMGELQQQMGETQQKLAETQLTVRGKDAQIQELQGSVKARDEEIRLMRLQDSQRKELQREQDKAENAKREAEQLVLDARGEFTQEMARRDSEKPEAPPITVIQGGRRQVQLELPSGTATATVTTDES